MEHYPIRAAPLVILSVNGVLKRGAMVRVGCDKEVLGLVGLGIGDNGDSHNNPQCSAGDNIFEPLARIFRKGEGGEAQNGAGQSGTPDDVHIRLGIVDEGLILVAIVLGTPQAGEQRKAQ